MSNQDYEQHEPDRQDEQGARANQQPGRPTDIGGLREDLSVDINDVSERRGRATIGEREDTPMGRHIPADAPRPGPAPKPEQQARRPGDVASEQRADEQNDQAAGI
ncbi:MAG TPA: hypothetical protein VFU69_02000 [Ktedonobacterales bacterium]|nr:hypothetical protein [Ktedonobacterales bacterium]